MKTLFEKLLENSKIDVEKGQAKESGVLEVNFKDLLAGAFEDILQKKSSLFRNMKEEGIEISFHIRLPEKNIKGSIYELVSSFKRDME